jgi:hypothetical protein
MNDDDDDDDADDDDDDAEIYKHHIYSRYISIQYI